MYLHYEPTMCSDGKVLYWSEPVAETWDDIYSFSDSYCYQTSDSMWETIERIKNDPAWKERGQIDLNTDVTVIRAIGGSNDGACLLVKKEVFEQ